MPPFISYAYNAEDVVLHRVFAGQANGFYVDIGAVDPARHSATKIVHDAGWRGLNVAFDAADQAALAAARPRDVTLLATPGEPPPPALLDALRPERAIDFLKIAGTDPAPLLASAALAGPRPRILVIEALDASGTPNHATWEPKLLAAGYRFALFDGVNRFYCRAEDAALLPHLASPANARDNWRPFREATAAARIAALTAGRAALQAQHGDYVRATLAHQRAAEATLAEARAARDAARQELHLVHLRLRDSDAALKTQGREIAGIGPLHRQLAEQRAALARLTASRSWRLTRPLRNVVRLAALLRPGG